MSERMVAMSAEQAEILDEIVIPQLMRDHDDQRASLMMGLALAWRFASPSEPEIPSNVYPIVRHAGDSWSRRVGA